MARVISITGGKEGVGTTFVSLNIAFCLSVMGHRTCLLFTDPNFPKTNFPLDVFPKGDISQVLNGESTLNDIITNSSENLDVILAGNAFANDRGIEADQAKRLSDSFFHASDYDFFIIDTPAGPSKNAISFSRAASEAILVFSPEPPAITSSYSLVKALGASGFSGRLSAVVNQSKNKKISELAVEKLNESASKFFQIKIDLLANIAKDASASRWTVSRKVFVRQNPDAAAAKDLQKMADRLIENKSSGDGEMGLDDFWKAYFVLYSANGNALDKLAGKDADEKINPIDPAWSIVSEGPISLSEGKNSTENEEPSPEIDSDNRLFPGTGDNPMGMLVQTIASLTREIKALRGLMERQTLFQNNPASDASSLPHQKVELDFDSFLSTRTK